jgi:hypothetical protein
METVLMDPLIVTVCRAVTPGLGLSLANEVRRAQRSFGSIQLSVTEMRRERGRARKIERAMESIERNEREGSMT